MNLLSRVAGVGLVGERKAVALLCLGFYATLFFLISLSARTELPEWVPVFSAMTAIYVTAFFAVGAEWFWGRWFATGIGYWGLTVTVMVLVTQRGLPPAMVMFGAMHALIALCLAGERMAAAFEAQPGWRERYHIDEQGVVRMRRSVTRAASSLPALIMFALAPREGAGMALLALAVIGVGGLVAARTWGVLALGAAGVGGLVLAVTGPVAPSLTPLAANLFGGMQSMVTSPALLVGFAGVMLCAAAAPFGAPMLSYLRRR